jgi:hypothetical protein
MPSNLRTEQPVATVPPVSLPVAQERPYLLLEDLLDTPFEWTLCEVKAPAPAYTQAPVVQLH